MGYMCNIYSWVLSITGARTLTDGDEEDDELEE